MKSQYTLYDKRIFARQNRENMTPAERELWKQLRRNNLGFRFKPQVIVRGYIVDFYCGAIGLVVEVDGSSHDSKEINAWDDQKEQALRRTRRGILRFTNEDVFDDMPMVLGKILIECEFRQKALARGALKGVGFVSRRASVKGAKKSVVEAVPSASLHNSENSKQQSSLSHRAHVDIPADQRLTPEEIDRIKKRLISLSRQMSFPYEAPMFQRAWEAKLRLATWLRDQQKKSSPALPQSFDEKETA